MKIFKLILNCVLPTLLVFSILLNILLLNGFEFTKNKKEVVPESKTSFDVTIDDFTNHKHKDPTRQDDIEITFSKDKNPSETTEQPGKLIFEDDNFKVTYLRTRKESSDAVHKIKVENKSRKPLTILFTDVIINDQKVYTSGLTCENLLPETTVIEDFVLYEKDWNHFTDSPTNVSFKIKLVNSKSRLDWYESDRIIFNIK